MHGKHLKIKYKHCSFITITNKVRNKLFQRNMFKPEPMVTICTLNIVLYERVSYHEKLLLKTFLAFQLAAL